MTSTELIIDIYKKLRRNKLAIISCALIMAGLLLVYAKNKRAVYTAKATVFPLTSGPESSISSSALSGILGMAGGGGGGQSFSSEASINIIELSQSRNVRQRVAVSRLPEFGNKNITQLLVEDQNSHKGFFEKPIQLPVDSVLQATLGSELLKTAITAKMNKNSVLEIYISHSNKALITPVALVFIDKLSEFYIDLKTTKALADYNFTIKKTDSLQFMLSGIDKRAVTLQNSTFFAPENRLEYQQPKENLTSEKIRLSRQRDASANNRDEATWKLQKVTPIISILDGPVEPFTVEKPSAILFVIIGLVTGGILAMLFLISGIFWQFVKSEVIKSLSNKDDDLPLVL